MTVQSIVQYPDPQLLAQSAVVTQFGDPLQTIINDLTHTLYATTGIGLSAPQIGVLQQVLVTDLTDDRTHVNVYINPEITAKAGYAIAHESCLSLPGIEAKVIRSAVVHVKALDKDGAPFEQELSGMDAICMQHEVDHLQGKLFISRISRWRRWFLRTQLSKLQSRSPSIASACSLS